MEKFHQQLGTLVAARNELLLLRKIFKEWIFRVASCCFYTILTASYLLYMDNFSFFGRNYNNFDKWAVFFLSGIWCNSYCYFVFRPFVQSFFSRQPVALSGDFVPLEWFSQTRCLAVLITLNTFPRQFATIKVEIVPLELNWQSSTFIQLTTFLIVYSRFLKQKNLIDSSVYGWSFPLCLMFPFMVFPCLV